MKSGNLLLGLLACAALCACTDNDSIGNSTPQVFQGDRAYMLIKISDVGSTTSRATFSTGTSAERAIDNSSSDGVNVHFYFYDEDGVYVTSSQGWQEVEDSDTEESDSNSELTGEKMVILNDLSNKKIPAYVVTIINQPADFTAPTEGKTLADMEKALSSAQEVGIYESESDDTKYFTMSTSSYLDSNRSDSYYFATPVAETDFYEGTKEIGDKSTDTNVIEIYVERLAAKVGLSIDIESKFTSNGSTITDWEKGGESTTTFGPSSVGNSTTKASSDGPYYYQITLDLTDVDDNGDIDEKEDEALYVKFDGWALNATAKSSNMMKNINTSWTDSSSFSNWNSDDNHRSYWGKSFNYNDDSYTYPDSSSEINDDSDALTYIPATDLSLDTDGSAVAYCAENTNTTDIITSKNSSAITSVLLKAEVCDNTGSAIDIVSCGNKIYTLDAYKAYALQHVGNYIYVKSGDNLTSITTDDLALGKNGTDGIVKVVVADDNTTYYDAEGNSLEDVQELLDEHFNNSWGYGANGYKGGLMYYNIPIQHNISDSDSEDIVEGQYGVVRNHYYVLTIDGVNSLGTGIYDENEQIVPTPETTTYYISAQVQILSWKLVSQNVTL